MDMLAEVKLPFLILYLGEMLLNTRKSCLRLLIGAPAYFLRIHAGLLTAKARCLFDLATILHRIIETSPRLNKEGALHAQTFLLCCQIYSQLVQAVVDGLDGFGIVQPLARGLAGHDDALAPPCLAYGGPSEVLRGEIWGPSFLLASPLLLGDGD
jgi:hypothetical protein